MFEISATGESVSIRSMPAHIRINQGRGGVTVRAVRASSGARDWAREVSGQADHCSGAERFEPR